MEAIASEQEEAMKENRLRELAFFKAKVPGTNLERYRLPTRTWLAAEMGNIPPEEFQQRAQEEAERLEKYVDRNRNSNEEKLSPYLDTLRIDHDVDDATPMQLSNEFIQRAEALPDDHAREAFIRGYMDFRLNKDVTRLGAKVRDGETKPNQLPKDWEYLFEGEFMRTLEDAHVYGRTAELNLDMLLDVERATNADLLGRLKPQAEQYLENTKAYSSEHKQPIKPQSDGTFERKLRSALEERAVTTT